MRKTILMLTLLLSAIDMMAQAYEFNTREYSTDQGTRVIECKMKDWAELRDSSPDIKLCMVDYYANDVAPFLVFELIKNKEQDNNSFAVVKELQKLESSIPGAKYKDVTTNLYLSNGDILRCTNRGCMIQKPTLIDILVPDFGRINFAVPPIELVSSRSPKEVGTKENLQLICQQLRTYDIVKIEVDGVSFDVRGLRSAATFDAMFNACAAKTGKGHLYRSPGYN